MASSLQEQVQCVRRELKLREKVYEHRIKDGKMSRTLAKYELQVMADVLKTLEELARNEPIMGQSSSSSPGAGGE